MTKDNKKSDSKKLKELERELEFIYSVVSDLHILEINDLYKKIVKIALSATGGDSCLLYVLDKKKNCLVLQASNNPHPKLLKRVKMKLGEGITGWVAKEKKIVAITKGAKNDPRFKYFRNLPEDKYQAFLSVPILNKRGVCGVINIQHKKEHNHTSEEKNLLSAIGKLVGKAIENALLVEQTLELKEALKIRKILDRAKGILMRNKNLTEEEAFRLIQRQSMNSQKSVKKIAEAILLADKLTKI